MQPANTTSRRKALKMVDRWNALYPTGQPVTYYEIRTVLNGGEVLEEPFDTFTRTAAFVSCSGHPVIFLDDKSGYVNLEHCRARQTPKHLVREHKEDKWPRAQQN